MKNMKWSLFLFSFFAFNALAAQTEITIYNQDLALLKKSQTTDFKKGESEIVFDEVAQTMKPESVFVYGKDIRVLEQNYDYAGINYKTLLEANIGKKVKTVRQNPTTGQNIIEEAELVSIEGDNPILRFDYGIETSFLGRVVFDTIPAGLNSTPILMAKVETADEGKKEVHLAYLATGLSWGANYVAKVNDDNTLSLLGRAAITNNSGSSYETAKVNLVAGDVNTVHEFLQPKLMLATRSNMLKTMDSDGFAEQSAVIDEPSSMDSYYIYNLGTTTLKNGQMKQVSFVNAPAVVYEKEGVLTSLLYFNTSKSYYKDVHPLVYYHFVNQKEDGLGMPMPKGKISFYAPDEHGVLQFIGENKIDNKAVGQKVSLQLGKFFDIYGEGKVVDLKTVESHKYKKNQSDNCLTLAETYHYDVVYTITNKGNKDVAMVLKQPMNGQVKIIKETLKGKAGDGNIHQWHFTIKAGQSIEIDAEFENVTEKYDCH